MNKSLLKFNLDVFKLYPKIFIKNFIIWLGVSLLPLLIGYVLSLFFSSAIDKEINQIIVFSVAYFILSLASNILLKYGGIIDAESKYFINSLLKKNIVHSFKYDVNLINNGKLVNILNYDTAVLQEIISAEIDLINRIIFCIGAFVILFSINFYISLICFLPMFILINLVIYFGNKICNYYQNRRKLSINFSDKLFQSLSNHRTIHYMNKSEHSYSELCKANKIKTSYEIKTEFISSLLDNIIILFQNFIYPAIMISSYFVIEKKEFSTGDFIIFLTYFSYGYNLISIFKELYEIMSFSKESINSMNETFDDEILSINYTKRNQVIPTFKDISKIEFKNFQLENELPLNFIVNKGDAVLLEGNDTLEIIKCLFSERDYHGEILINDTVLVNEMRLSCGVVSSNPHLFDDSIVNNIVLCKEESNIDIDTVLKDCEIENRFVHWNLKSDSIGIDGKRLSEGQRMRVAIGRAVYHSKGLLIFNNGFVSIDKETAKVIYENVLKYNILFFTNQSDYCFKNCIVLSKRTNWEIIYEQKKI